METIAELRKHLEQALSLPPEQAAERVIGAYKAAASTITLYKEFQVEAKLMMADIMAETGQTEFSTQSGKLYVTSAGAVTDVDTKKLLAACEQDQQLKSMIEPFIFVKGTGGVTTIR